MIIIKLTLTDIQKHNPCADGIALFKEWYGDSCEIEWTPLWQVMCSVSPAKDFYTWLAYRGLVPFYNLIGADLRSANLYGANLYGANLYGANLRSANLYGANLYCADLRSANLRSADLYCADLRSADLRSADLRSANLYGANLESALHNEYTRWPNGFDKSRLTQ